MAEEDPATFLKFLSCSREEEHICSTGFQICKRSFDFMVSSVIPSSVSLKWYRWGSGRCGSLELGHLGIAQLVYFSDVEKGRRSGEVKGGILIRD